MTSSQPPHSARIRQAPPIEESTAVIPYERKTSKRFEAGVTTTDPTPIIATAHTASSKSTRTSGMKPAPSTTESAATTPLKKKPSKLELAMSSIKSKVSTVKKSAISQAKSLASLRRSSDPARPGTSGAEGTIIGPTIKEQIILCIDDYNALIKKEFPNTPQYDPTFVPSEWEDDYTDLWQRYEEVTLSTQIIHDDLDDYAQSDLEDLYFELLILVEIIFNIEFMRDDRLLELPDLETTVPEEKEVLYILHPAFTLSCCQIRVGHYTEILKLCAELDEDEPVHTPGWIFDFDLLLDDIYNGHCSEVARTTDNAFKPAAATSRRDKYTGGTMLTWSRRRYLVEQYYQQTSLWVESDQQRSDSLARFAKKVEQEIETNVLPTEFFTSREEDKGKGKGTGTSLKVELGAKTYMEDSLKDRLEQAKAQQELEEAKAQRELEEAKAKRNIKETTSPTLPEKPKSETKLTFEDVLGTTVPSPSKKEAEVKKPLTPKPKPKVEGEGPSASKQPLLTPQEVATLYQVDLDLLTKILFQAGELKTVPVLEVTKPTKPLKSSLKQEVKRSKTAKKKVVIEKKRTKCRKSKRDKSPSSSSSSSEEESESDSQGLTSSSDHDTNKAFRDLFKKQTSPRRSTKAAASAATMKKIKAAAEMESSESPSDKDEDDNGESEETPTTTETETETTETTESEEPTRTRRRRTRPRVSASFLKELQQAIPKYHGTRSLQKLYNFVDKVDVYIRAKPDVTDEEIIDLVELKLEGAAVTWWRSARNKVAPGHKRRLKYRTWQDVRRGLQKTLAPKEDALAMRKRLQVLKQTGSVAKYNDQFWQISKQIIAPNWEELKFHYLQGLDPKLADLVQAYPLNTKSQEKMFLAALRLESTHGAHGSREKGKTTTRSTAAAAESDYVKTPDKKGKPAHKKSTPHQFSSSSNTPDTKKDAEKKLTKEKEHKCELCDNKGHYEQKCRTAKRAIENARKARGDNREERADTYHASLKTTNEAPTLQGSHVAFSTKHKSSNDFGCFPPHASGDNISVIARGTLTIQTSLGTTLVLHNVLCSPKLGRNLVSIAQLQKSGFAVTFPDKPKKRAECVVSHTGQQVAYGCEIENLYRLRGNIELPEGLQALITQTDGESLNGIEQCYFLQALLTTANDTTEPPEPIKVTSLLLYHHRLGHPGMNTMRLMKKEHPELKKVKIDSTCQFKGCNLGKSSRTPHIGPAKHRATI
ncbi:hypothetical protein HDU88_000878 [Geranomyces variabilis]|nr:hypothetical protein HDU88_000878 [Geranomyces variabilis]